MGSGFILRMNISNELNSFAAGCAAMRGRKFNKIKLRSSYEIDNISKSWRDSAERFES